MYKISHCGLKSGPSFQSNIDRENKNVALNRIGTLSLNGELAIHGPFLIDRAISSTLVLTAKIKAASIAHNGGKNTQSVNQFLW